MLANMHPAIRWGTATPMTLTPLSNDTPWCIAIDNKKAQVTNNDPRHQISAMLSKTIATVHHGASYSKVYHKGDIVFGSNVTNTNSVADKNKKRKSDGLDQQ